MRAQAALQEFPNQGKGPWFSKLESHGQGSGGTGGNSHSASVREALLVERRRLWSLSEVWLAQPHLKKQGPFSWLDGRERGWPEPREEGAEAPAQGAWAHPPRGGPELPRGPVGCG